MPDESNDHVDSSITQSQDTAIQRAVLALLLFEHPIPVTLPELVHRVAEDPADFSQRDAVERAVRDLLGADLLRRDGGHVLPANAALYFDRLNID